MWSLKRLALNGTKLNREKAFYETIKFKYIQNLALDLNRKDQLFEKGTDAAGDVIGRYSPTTEILSEGKTFSFQGENKRKIAGEPLMLYDTGDFFTSFSAQATKDGLIIKADSILPDGRDLTKQYGKEILGLNKESKAKFAQEAKKPFVREIKKQFLKGVK